MSHCFQHEILVVLNNRQALGDSSKWVLMCHKKGVTSMMMPSGIDGWHNTKALWALSVVQHWLPTGNPQS